MRVLFCIFVFSLCAELLFSQVTASTPSILKVSSKDGTQIAVECMGSGPSLLIVHGGSGDRKRWKPLLPLFASRFNVCAMDRRGHGDSIDSSAYSLQKEFEDVVAVVNSLPGSVAVLGHSYGGICALEASLLTKKIARLILYEPPLQDRDHSAVALKMEKMIGAGNRDGALLTFLSEIVMVSREEIEEMKRRPSWADRVSGTDIQIREIRALARYRFTPNKFRHSRIPTLLLTGTQTASPQLKLAIRSLMDTLPDRTLVELKGQGHNAMDAIPRLFAETVLNYLERSRFPVRPLQAAANRPAKAAIDPIRNFLLTSAANDFHEHGPKGPLQFRNVRAGHVRASDGKDQYLMCGEFLQSQEGDKAEWTKFATIKTSGYEQYIGENIYCQRPTIVWGAEGDLSALLQKQFDSLKSTK